MAIFGIPCGVDFSAALLDGLDRRMAGKPKEDLARVEIFVNTQRMRRRLTDLFAARGAGFIPAIKTITERIDPLIAESHVTPKSANAQLLSLAPLVRKLLEFQPELGGDASVLSLTQSLIALQSEMAFEGVSANDLAALDLPDQAGHWQNALQFISAISDYLDANAHSSADRQFSNYADALIAKWQAAPPDHPVIVAGSTGSRGTTFRIMQAVNDLPHGSIVFPGVDFDMPQQAWDSFEIAADAEDHPQYRFYRFCKTAGQLLKAVKPWAEQRPASPPRNKLMSLALRPAPVTDAWLLEGPRLQNIAAAMADVTLLQANRVKQETTAIALRLREAAENGETAALISPDRNLTRQVTAILQTWNIEPDDSAGTGLHLSVPGRLVRQVASLIGRRPDLADFLALLKHPLMANANRRDHLELTRTLEIHLRKNAVAEIAPGLLTTWSSREDQSEAAKLWAEAWEERLAFIEDAGQETGRSRFERHMQIVESIVEGDAAELYAQNAGEALTNWKADLEKTFADDLDLPAEEYFEFIAHSLSSVEVRSALTPHPQIMIWGTLEARVQGCDLVILAGLNEGTWPELPPLDPWLNRAMRRDVGLPSPERRMGLSAHDFQQAVASPKVWITRSLRTDDADTVPSRWVNRLSRLLTGIGDEGRQALSDAQNRGQNWLDIADQYLAPSASYAPALRPAPQPPLSARPKRLSVTQIETLIRDPFAIYARHVLGLQPLDPLVAGPDHRMRGIVVHRILELFGDDTKTGMPSSAAQLLEDIARREIDAVPSASIGAIWLARFREIIPDILDFEAELRDLATPFETELYGTIHLPEIDFKLSGRADRVDQLDDGTLAIFDYKTGKPPTFDQTKYFNPQLQLLALIAAHNGFKDLSQNIVGKVGYIEVGNNFSKPNNKITVLPHDQTREELTALIKAHRDPQAGFSSRSRVDKDARIGDYDHLARFGEWAASDPVNPQKVGDHD